MNFLSKKHPMNDGVIIVLSSISSTATYIFIDKMLSHLEHPSEVFILATGLTAMFVCILFLFRKRNLVREEIA